MIHPSLILALLLSATAVAEESSYFEMHQSLLVGKSETPLEISNYILDPAADPSAVLDQIREKIADTEKKYPENMKSFAAIDFKSVSREPANDSAPNRNLKVLLEELSKESPIAALTIQEAQVKAMGNFIDRNYRVIFTVTRGVVNGTGAFLVVLATHGPVEATIAGVATMISASALQWNNERLGNFTTGKQFTNLLLGKLPSGAALPPESRLKRTTRNILGFMEENTRWLFTEICYTQYLKIAMYLATGSSPAPDTDMLVTGLKGFAAQGFGDIANASWRNGKLDPLLADTRKYATEGNTEALAETLRKITKVRKQADFIAATLSVATVSTTLMDLAKVTIADSLFKGIGAGGFLYWLKIKTSSWFCKKNLRPQKELDELPNYPRPGNGPTSWYPGVRDSLLGHLSSTF